jgi:formamidopyrimidine-DNA glycosylase
MPELPEVETIVRALRDGGRDQPSILHRTVQDSRVLWKRTLAEPGIATFKRQIMGKQIQDVGRRGKFVVIDLQNETLLFHLRMSGDLRVEEANTALQTHDRLVLDFEDGFRLVFNDTRKFGRAWLVEDRQSVLGELGPEPLDPKLTAVNLHSLLVKKHRQLKPLLLDQKFVAGLGNIYTDEALHAAKLHPLRNSDSVTLEQSAVLLKSIRKVLREGIKRNGASIDWVYRGGDFQNHFSAYQCTGEPCPVCGTPIERMIIGQRSTHYCPTCQPFV